MLNTITLAHPDIKTIRIFFYLQVFSMVHTKPLQGIHVNYSLKDYRLFKVFSRHDV